MYYFQLIARFPGQPRTPAGSPKRPSLKARKRATRKRARTKFLYPAIPILRALCTTIGRNRAFSRGFSRQSASHGFCLFQTRLVAALPLWALSGQFPICAFCLPSFWFPHFLPPGLRLPPTASRSAPSAPAPSERHLGRTRGLLTHPPSPSGAASVHCQTPSPPPKLHRGGLFIASRPPCAHPNPSGVTCGYWSWPRRVPSKGALEVGGAQTRYSNSLEPPSGKRGWRLGEGAWLSEFCNLRFVWRGLVTHQKQTTCNKRDARCTETHRPAPCSPN